MNKKRRVNSERRERDRKKKERKRARLRERETDRRIEGKDRLKRKTNIQIDR